MEDERRIIILEVMYKSNMLSLLCRLRTNLSESVHGSGKLNPAYVY